MSLDAKKNRTTAPLRPFGWREALLTTGGLGFLRPAPGTWGSIPPVAIGAIILIVWPGDLVIYHAVMAASVVVFSLACVCLGRYAGQRFRRANVGPSAKENTDAPEIVADETAGQALAMLGWPALIGSDGGERPLLALLGCTAAAFFAFRVFDIIKPWPCRRLEKLSWGSGGAGVLADDLMAGVYAGLCIAALALVVG